MKITSVKADYDGRYIKMTGAEYVPTYGGHETKHQLEKIESVKLDNQSTFNCIDGPSDAAQLLGPMEGRYLNESLPMDGYICEDINEELLFMFVTVRSWIYYFYDKWGSRWVRVRVGQDGIEYETSVNFNVWSQIDTSSPVKFTITNGGEDMGFTTGEVDEFKYLNAASVKGLGSEMAISDDTDENRGKLLRYGEEVIFKAMLYNDKALMRYVLDHVKALLGTDCCKNIGKAHCEYLMMRNGFLLAVAGKKYKEACLFWQRLHKNKSKKTAKCNCNG